MLYWCLPDCVSVEKITNFAFSRVVQTVQTIVHEDVREIVLFVESEERSHQRSDVFLPAPHTGRWSGLGRSTVFWIMAVSGKWRR